MAGEYRLRVKRALDVEAGIEIPFPHRTLFFGDDHDTEIALAIRGAIMDAQQETTQDRDTGRRGIRGRSARRSEAGSGTSARMAEPLLFERWPEIEARIRAADHVLLACDFDGTLSPIVPRPEDAYILSACADAHCENCQN